MQYQYDANTDCAYILINDLPHSYSVEVDDRRFIDYAKDGTIIGVELLYISNGVDLSDLPYETEIGDVLAKHNINVLRKDKNNS